MVDLLQANHRRSTHKRELKVLASTVRWGTGRPDWLGRTLYILIISDGTICRACQVTFPGQQHFQYDVSILRECSPHEVFPPSNPVRLSVSIGCRQGNRYRSSGGWLDGLHTDFELIFSLAVCGSVTPRRGCSGASGILKPLNNSQKGRRMISNAATGRARNCAEPPGEGSITPNQPAMLPKNTRA